MLLTMSRPSQRQLVSWVSAMVVGSVAIPGVAVTQQQLQMEAVHHRNEGMRLQAQGHLEEAITMFQRAIALDPGYATPHNDVGIIYETVGRVAEAERAYQAALALNPTYLQAHTNLALLYEQQGRNELALHHWQQRYQLGFEEDSWKRLAAQRLMAAGVLPPQPLMAAPPTPSQVDTEAAAPFEPPPPATVAAVTTPPLAPPSALPGFDTAPEFEEPSPQQRAAQDQFARYDVILREFEAVTDPEGTTWGRRPYTTATGTHSP